MSNTPAHFVNSDDESDAIITRGGTKVVPITINAGTSTSRLSPSNVKSSVDPAPQVSSPSLSIERDVYSILRKVDDLTRQMATLTAKQQSMHTLLLELRSEFEVIRSSSARFQSTTTTTGLRSSRRGRP